MNETQFQQRILDYCEWKRIRAYHVQRSDRGIVTSKGFPDLVLVGKRVVFAELKSERGKMTTNQYGWANDLRAAGAEFHLWRPSDWDRVKEVIDSLV